MEAHLIDTHLLVPRTRSSAKVKVKYQGHVSQKMGVSEALVFHKYIFFFLCPRIKKIGGHIVLPLSIRPSFRPSVCLHKLNVKT